MTSTRRTFGGSRQGLMDEQSTAYTNEYHELETVPEARLRASPERPSLLNRLESLVNQTEVAALHKSLPQFRQLDTNFRQKSGYVNIGSPERKKGNVTQSHYFGFRRKTVVGFCIVLAACITIAVILGSVLGTRLKKLSTTETLELQGLSGIAILSAGGIAGTAFGFFQAPDGSLREREIQGSSWITKNSSQEDDIVVASAVAKDSPLAAIAHTFSYLGQPTPPVRYLFFQHRFGFIMSTNRTETTKWSDPIPIIETYEAIPGNIALTAVSITSHTHGNPENGVRVFYGSLDGGMGQVCHTGIPQVSSTWEAAEGSSFPDSDNLSGAVSTSDNGQLRVYTRLSGPGSLSRWVYGNGTWDKDWPTSNEKTTSDPLVETGSDITTCTDGSGTGIDHVFYQTASGSLVWALSISSGIRQTRTIGTAVIGSKLSATYNDGSDGGRKGPVVFFQAPETKTGLSFLRLDQDGNQVEAGVVRS